MTNPDYIFYQIFSNIPVVGQITTGGLIEEKR